MSIEDPEIENGKDITITNENPVTAKAPQLRRHKEEEQ